MSLNKLKLLANCDIMQVKLQEDKYIESLNDKEDVDFGKISDHNKEVITNFFTKKLDEGDIQTLVSCIQYDLNI